MDKKGGRSRIRLENRDFAQVIALYALLLLFLGFFPFQLPGGPIITLKNLFGSGLDTWGISKYGFYPVGIKLAATLFMLLLLAPKANAGLLVIISKAYSHAAGFGIARNKLVACFFIYLIIPLAFLAAFYYAPNKSLGATGVFEDMLGRNLLFIGSNPLSTYVNYLLFSAAKETSAGFFHDLAADPARFIRAMSNVSGFFFVLFLIHISCNLFAETRKKIIFFTFLASQGYMFLFFYDHDTHPHQVVFLILFVYYAIKYIRGQAGIILPALFLSISSLMHMASFIFIPSLFLLPVLRRDAQTSAPDRTERQPFVLRALDGLFSSDSLKAFLCLVLPMLLFFNFIVVPNQDRFYGGTYGDLIGGGDKRMFLPLFKAETAYEKYTMFSWDNFSDKMNMLLFLCPMTLLLGALFLVKYGKEIMADGVQRFLLINFTLGALFIFMWSADYGVKFDWNLFSPAAIMMSALAAYILSEKSKEEYYSYICIVAIFYSVMHLLTLLS
jgi:hypothetical protein